MRPTCKICGTNVVTSNGKNKHGVQTYKSVCSGCHKKKYTRKKGYVCEMCGFVPEHRCQLDVDHIDGNKGNESASNLQTICANCHRLKTFRNGDNLNNRYRI